MPEVAQLSSGNQSVQAASIEDFLAKIPDAEPGWEEQSAPRQWKSSLLLIKPRYLQKRTIGKTVQVGDVTWVRLTDNTVAGLKLEGNTIVAVKQPDPEALLKLGSVDEEGKAAVQAELERPEREEYERLRAKFEGA